MTDIAYMSQDISQLALALSKVQGSVGLIPKSKTAKLGTYSYKYADLGDIWDAIRDALRDNEISVTQVFLNCNNVDFMETILLHSSGQWIKSRLQLSEHEKIQSLGSEITYLRRYALSSILGLATDEDEDGQMANSSARAPMPPKAGPKPTIYGKQEDVAATVQKELDLSRLINTKLKHLEEPGLTVNDYVDHINVTSKKPRLAILESANGRLEAFSDGFKLFKDNRKPKSEEEFNDKEAP